MKNHQATQSSSNEIPFQSKFKVAFATLIINSQLIFILINSLRLRPDSLRGFESNRMVRENPWIAEVVDQGDCSILTPADSVVAPNSPASPSPTPDMEGCP